MRNEFCPRCNRLRDMNVSRFYREELVAGVREKRILMEIWSCATCMSFVSSEEREEPASGTVSGQDSELAPPAA